MVNNTVLFYEQQKKAFYEQNFETLTLAELEELVRKNRAKKEQAQFPLPEQIFKKKFRFLSDTLEVIRTRMQSGKTAAVIPKKVEAKRQLLKKSKHKTADTSQTPKKPMKQKTKLGVLLEANSKSDTDSDNSFIIPHEFGDIITNALKGKRNSTGRDLELIIEAAPLTKRELREFKARTKWVDDLIESDCESSENSKERQAAASPGIARSPLLMLSPSLSDSGTKQHSRVCRTDYLQDWKNPLLEGTLKVKALQTHSHSC